MSRVDLPADADRTRHSGSKAIWESFIQDATYGLRMAISAFVGFWARTAPAHITTFVVDVNIFWYCLEAMHP